MVEQAERNLWVGKYGENKYVVYDPGMQSSGNFYLYEVFSGQMATYNKQQIKEDLQKVNDHQIVQQCLRKYYQWISWYGYQFEKDVLHKKETTKVPYDYYRDTKCWKCGRKITDLSADACNICGWLKCPHCGACKKDGCPGSIRN